MTNTTRNRGNTGRSLRATVLAAALLCAGPVAAFDLALPGNARETARQDSAPDSHPVATGPFADGALPADTVEGVVSRAAWRVSVQGITTLQLLGPLRDQLASEGFDILFECDAAACGGFDFRYRLEVFPEPAMRVDLFDYRYLSARRGTDGAAEHVAILVSRSTNAGFVQITTITPQGARTPTTSTSGTPVRTTTAAPANGLTLSQQLETLGHAVLGDLTFQTGSATLGNGDFGTLAELANFLRADPDRRVALVGHTDAVGSLDNNIALSKRRAASVLERLVSAHGISRSQLAAEGMGYLSPITTNLTAEGRDRNRRVEVILLNTK